jgi:hypothetical protein
MRLSPSISWDLIGFNMVGEMGYNDCMGLMGLMGYNGT